MDFKVKESRILNQEEKAYAMKLGISERFLSLLLSRGIELDEIYDYLHPSLDKLSNPLEIKDMDKARDRLIKAINNKEKILIYGDYDVDGICATSILMLYLKDKTEVQFYIPKRAEGYGIKKESIDNLFSRKKFDLMVSVDTGITAAEEVEYIMSKGVDVIVTDHHEPQINSVPNCIVVDPKIEKKGFYELCGAGVALKLVEACSSRREIEKYLDICSLATIADVVPLLKDNRIIVSYGLKMIAKNPRKGIKMLQGDDEISAHNVMYKIGPRINSAGRMDTAMKVVDLFVEEDYFMLKTLAEELFRDNKQRQDLCATVEADAIAMLKGVDFNKTRLITLYKENWESGVLGIAAARIVEEFKCPTILFSLVDGEIKGSARSIKDVNLFELLEKHTDLYTSFGGHSQAAGVSMKFENYEKFKTLCNEELLKEKDYRSFLPKVECEMELPFDMDFLSFAKELKMMEPTGHENARPNFLINGSNLKFEAFSNGQHVKFKNSNIELIGFSRYYESLFAKTGNIQFEVTLDVNEFQNKYTAQANISSINVKSLNLSQTDSDCLNLHQYRYSNNGSNTYINKISNSDVENMLSKPFGTLFVCFSQDDYVSLINRIQKVKSLPVAIAQTKFMNPENSVIICPGENFKFMQYDNVIIAGRANTYGYYSYIKNQANNTYSLDNLSIGKVELTDEMLANIYKAIVIVVERERKVKVTKAQLFKLVQSRIKVQEASFYLALMIFDELDLVSITEKGLLIISKQKTNLRKSSIYNNFNQLV